MMAPAEKIKMALLAAKLAKEALDLLALDSAGLAKLHFRQIVADMKALDDHISALR